MKINQDNYIQMFNELFMKQRENSMDKIVKLYETLKKEIFK